MKSLQQLFYRRSKEESPIVLQEYLAHCHNIAIIIASQSSSLTTQQMLDLYAKMVGLE